MGAVTLVSSDTRRENRARNGDDASVLTLWASVTMSASYTTGGDLFDVSSVFPSKCRGAALAGRTAVNDPKWAFTVASPYRDRPELLRIRAFDTTAGAEAPAGTDLHLEGLALAVEGV